MRKWLFLKIFSVALFLSACAPAPAPAPSYDYKFHPPVPPAVVIEDGKTTWMYLCHEDFDDAGDDLSLKYGDHILELRWAYCRTL